MRCSPFVLVTVILVFILGWRLGASTFSILTWLICGDVGATSNLGGELARTWSPFVGVLIGGAWAGMLLARAYSRQLQKTTLHLNFWLAFALLGWMSISQIARYAREYRGKTPESAARAMVADLYGAEVANHVTLSTFPRADWPPTIGYPTHAMVASDEKGPLCRLYLYHRWSMWFEYAGHEKMER